jgi:hypothetical protein
MTLTITQLQQMYGTNSVQTLRGASPNDAASSRNNVDVLERSATHTSHEIIPDDDNPLFMTVEQRVEAHRRQENIKREQEIQEVKHQAAEAFRNIETLKREQAEFEALSPEEQVIYYEQKQQRKLAEYHIYQEKEIARIEKLKASLPPRIEGALGEDLRLKDAYTSEQANFLEQMKVKYAAVKNALSPPQPELEPVMEVMEMPYFPRMRENPEYDPRSRAREYNATIDKMHKDLTPSIEAHRQLREEQVQRNKERLAQWEANNDRVGNSFVLGLSGTFSQIQTYAERINHNRSMMQSTQHDLEAGADRPFLKEQIARHQQIIDETIPQLDHWLTYLKKNTDSHGVQHEITAFFSDYMQFHTGKSYDLNALYREVGLS